MESYSVKGLFVTGTDTGVGKTWVAARLILHLKSLGLDIEPRKPVESGWTDEKESDAWALAEAAGKTDKIDEICPNHFKAAISPDRAAEKEGELITTASIYRQCVETVKQEQFLIVEGAGGFYSPLCSDGLNADLAVKLKLPVLLVVANRLGCINHTLLTLKAINDNKVLVRGLVLNDVDGLGFNNSMNNDKALKELTNLPVFCIDNEPDSLANNQALDELAMLVKSTK